MPLLQQSLYFRRVSVLIQIILRLIFISLLAFFPSWALATGPVSSTLTPDDNHGNNFLLKLEIEDGWKVYGPYPGDDGIPLKIESNNSPNLKNLKIIWPTPMHLKGNNIYQNGVAIPLLAEAKNPESNIHLQLTLNMVACKGICKQVHQTLSSESTAAGKESHSISFIAMLLMAAVGGFILNMMPCVLPVVTLKIYSIVKYSGKTESYIRLNALLTSLGILSTFMALALAAIMIRSAGGYAGWGLHFQNHTFLIILTTLLFISVMVIREEIIISLPNIFQNTAGYNNYIASFLSGALTTIFATPCTAPFITPVIAFALTQDYATIASIYCAIGIGMASPFLLLSIRPRMIRALPKPGPWMNRLKSIFGFLMILTVVWLLYILLEQLGIKSVILISGCLLLLKFFLTHLSSWKAAVAALAISIMMVSAPHIIYKQNATQALAVDKYWEPFSQNKLDSYIAHGDVVFVDVTADWCLLCKINKLLILDNVPLLEYLQIHEVKMIRADITSTSKNIMEYMKANNRQAIPFNVIYGPKSPYRIVLPEILTAEHIRKAVNELKK